MIRSISGVLRGSMSVQPAWLRIRSGIVFVAFAITVVPSTGFGEQLSVVERALLEAVVASNTSAISAANAVEWMSNPLNGTLVILMYWAPTSFGMAVVSYMTIRFRRVPDRRARR